MSYRRLYHVRPGDTPARITATFTGSDARMRELIAANLHKRLQIVFGVTTFESLSPDEWLFLPETWALGRMGDEILPEEPPAEPPPEPSPEPSPPDPESPPETGGQEGDRGGGYGGSAPPKAPPGPTPGPSPTPSAPPTPSPQPRLTVHPPIYSRALPTTSVTPPAPMSAGTKVAIGVGVVGAASVGGLWLYAQQHHMTMGQAMHRIFGKRR